MKDISHGTEHVEQAKRARRKKGASAVRPFPSTASRLAVADALTASRNPKEMRCAAGAARLAAHVKQATKRSCPS